LFTLSTTQLSAGRFAPAFRERMLEKLSSLATEHEADLCASLTMKEREQLAALGRKIVHQQGLTPDVHPGYRKL
jgi:hypothetical protein